jgi:hypothetical protein
MESPEDRSARRDLDRDLAERGKFKVCARKVERFDKGFESLRTGKDSFVNGGWRFRTWLENVQAGQLFDAKEPLEVVGSALIQMGANPGNLENASKGIDEIAIRPEEVGSRVRTGFHGDNNGDLRMNPVFLEKRSRICDERENIGSCWWFCNGRRIAFH